MKQDDVLACTVPLNRRWRRKRAQTPLSLLNSKRLLNSNIHTSISKSVLYPFQFYTLHVLVLARILKRKVITEFSFTTNTTHQRQTTNDKHSVLPSDKKKTHQSNKVFLNVSLLYTLWSLFSHHFDHGYFMLTLSIRMDECWSSFFHRQRHMEDTRKLR